MKKLLYFISKYNILYLAINFIVVLICFNKYKYNLYLPYSDIGREFYIPSQMNNGCILYKDIFNVYAPLGYQINSIIIKFFSNKLNTFYSIGLFLTIINLTTIFLISKIFTNKGIAFAITMLLIPTCVFFPSISNWITPYSYSVLYALSFILCATYFLIRYIKEENPNYIVLSWLFYGASIVSKYEFSGFIIPLIFSMTVIKSNKKDIFKSILYFITVPFISFFSLIIQGTTIKNIYDSFFNMINLLNSYSIKYIYFYNGFNISKITLVNAIISIKEDLIYIILNIRRYIQGLTSITDMQTNALSMRFTGYLCILLSILLIIKVLKKKQSKEKEDLALICISLCAITTSFKCIGSISFEIYGTFFFPLLTIAIFSIIYSSKFIKIFNRILIFILISITFFYYMDNNKNINEMKFKKLNTTKGEIKIRQEFYNETKEIIDYIKTNTTEEDVILLIPEGVLINYLSDRKSDNNLYYLIPPNCEIRTSENIINNLKESKPKYIIISNIIYNDYGQTSFKNSWGMIIFDYISKEYKYMDTIGEDFTLNIYKL